MCVCDKRAEGWVAGGEDGGESWDWVQGVGWGGAIVGWLRVLHALAVQWWFLAPRSNATTIDPTTSTVTTTTTRAICVQLLNLQRMLQSVGVCVCDLTVLVAWGKCPGCACMCRLYEGDVGPRGHILCLW